MDPEVQIIIAVVAGIPALVIGILAYQRSKKVDAIAAQSGVVTETRAGTAQIIEGLNLLVDQLQDDNRTQRDDNRADRDDIKSLKLQLAAAFKERDEIKQERDELRREIRRLKREYGDNDNGNGTGTPKENHHD